MAIAATNKNAGAPTATIPDRITDAIRHGAHFSHQVRLMKSMARDAGEEGVHAAKRAMRRAQWALDRIDDVRHDAAHRIRREPFKAVGFAAAAGVLVGVAFGCIAISVKRTSQTSSTRT
jgi:ElaB/YqjD/DUF883 family membrane-anchored ribosome-binding protein